MIEQMNRWIDLSSYNIKLIWLDYPWSQVSVHNSCRLDCRTNRHGQTGIRQTAHRQVDGQGAVQHRHKQVYRQETSSSPTYLFRSELLQLLTIILNSLQPWFLRTRLRREINSMFIIIINLCVIDIWHYNSLHH